MKNILKNRVFTYESILKNIRIQYIMFNHNIEGSLLPYPFQKLKYDYREMCSPKKRDVEPSYCNPSKLTRLNVSIN